MAYKEKLEQQGSQRRRKFSTHLDIPDRDVLFRSEVSFTYYYYPANNSTVLWWSLHGQQCVPCPHTLIQNVDQGIVRKLISKQVRPVLHVR